MLSKGIKELGEGLRKKEFSSVELTKLYLEEIEKKDDKIEAFLTVTAEKALEMAEKADKMIAEGRGSYLTGIPMAVKDNICTKGIKTTCASKMLNNFVPPYEAHVTDKLFSDGAVMLGKVNMDEFAMGSTTENSAFKTTKNPRNLSHVPGGSSGGSAAAVAAGECVYALGSDTGGSIRQPASFCGVVGMKPTYGSVSRYGLVAFASSLDQIGPLTRSIWDNAAVLTSISGHDERDTTSIKREFGDFTSEIGKDVKGMKIGIIKEFFGAGISDEVKEAVLGAAKKYESMGAELVELSIPTLDYALPAYYVISSAEASSNLARFDGARYGYRSEKYDDITELYKNSRSEGFGAEVKRRIMLGTFALSSGYYDAYYKKALQVRTLIIRDFNKAFESCDFILSPVSPTTAYKIGEKTSDPLEMYLGDIYTVPINIAGVPSLSMPCAVGKDNLPIGMQLIGPLFSEDKLYKAGYAFEEATR